MVIRFEDTGVGISSPDGLFRPFQQGADATGLGLYVSRATCVALAASCYLNRASEGCCFAVRLARVPIGKKLHDE